MGCCLGTESGSRSGYADFNNNGGGAPRGRPETEADRQARMLAAEKAAQRQQNFEQSAVGRAAYTAVKDAKRPVNTQPVGVSARDWQGS